ncbi:MAG: CpsD/CapB family tyrosine-protein kinase [Alphaproteobacteria bacterium]|nr:CpsD/CapB family tyrosine-protein kinase [Alphaproteobacteria bacterium]MBU1561611.1 CpsD/CapB family tyrosine-protein kinase [Alphaproteobacteria bacterium]MBU2302408.1 CpsD/CapB family tyrosine-protein kinase [Alphaproteobacteria bacterium]MBU2368688.1 CpsD/CapB family tyrosine-protein kinase [Alphaproteobacteria bacterium]
MTAYTKTPTQKGRGSQLQTFGTGVSSWSRLAALQVDSKTVCWERIVSLKRRHPAAVAFDIMRTKVLKSAREENWRTIGITAPVAGGGKSTVAANLAISLSKHEKLRVVLVDLDLRSPRLAQMLAHKGQYSVEEFLRGQCPIEDFFVRLGDNLAIGASPEPGGRDLTEVLHSSGTAHMLELMRDDLAADIVIYNLPPLLAGDDCLGLLPLVEASLLVVGADFNTVADIDVCESLLQSRTNLLGVVLNKCRYRTEAYADFLA